MFQSGTKSLVIDKTGVMESRCIKVVGYAKKLTAKLGRVVMIAVTKINPKKFVGVKLHKRKRFLKGTVHRALIIRACWNYKRLAGIHYRFNCNGVIIVNKKNVPVSNRLYGPVLREFCIKYPSLGSISRFII